MNENVDEPGLHAPMVRENHLLLTSYPPTVMNEPKNTPARIKIGTIFLVHVNSQRYCQLAAFMVEILSYEHKIEKQ